MFRINEMLPHFSMNQVCQGFCWFLKELIKSTCLNFQGEIGEMCWHAVWTTTSQKPHVHEQSKNEIGNQPTLVILPLELSYLVWRMPEAPVKQFYLTDSWEPGEKLKSDMLETVC